MRAIIGVIVAFVIGLLSIIVVRSMQGNASNLNSVTTLAGEISTLTGGIDTDFGGYGSFSNITTSMVIVDGDAPTSMISGNNLVGPWGGFITVNPDANSTSEYDISIPNIPQSECAKVVASIADFLSVTINGGTAMTAPINPSTVATTCQSGKNTFVFAFGRG